MSPPAESNRRDPKSTVKSGYDQASHAYRSDEASADSFGHDEREYREWLAPFFAQLPAGGRILDLGCGIGVPADRILVERFEVTGVDIYEIQLGRARRLVPRASFLEADMTEVEFPHGHFDGAVALYSLIHVPVDDQPALLQRVYGWLRPGGLFLAITGHTAWTGYEETWLGSPGAMYWSHADAGTYQRWLVRAGFVVRHRRYVPEGETGHELFLLEKGAGHDRSALG